MSLYVTTPRPRLGHSVVRANMAGAGAALTIAGFLLIVFQFIALHAALVRDVHVQARIVGANSVAALLFNDRRAAEETLGALEASPSLRAAGIFSALRKPLALYQHGDAAPVRAPDAAMLRESAVSTLTTLEVVEPVESERRVIGYVVVRSSLSELYMQLLGYAVLTVSVGIGAMGLAYLVIARMRRAVLQAEAHLDYLAHIDSVTELPNRHAFNERLQVSLKRAGQTGAVGLLLLDLDNFKVVNDTLGHNNGDRLLRQVARRLNDVIEQANLRAVLCRIGGDEFAVIAELSGRAQIAETEAATLADGLAKRILAALGAPFSLDLHQIYVTASVGVSLYPHDARDVQVLTRNADTAMYHAKNHGKNAAASFTSEMDQQARRRLRVEADLRRALDREELLLAYQPQVRLSTDDAHDAVISRANVYGVEALVRWRHPEIGLIGPGEFIAVAEETGLIVPLGLWVLRTACQQAVRWMREDGVTLRVAVNLSARQTRDPALVENVMDVLRETGMPPHQLELEITESVLMEDIEANIALLESLHAAGISLSIDDFGTGYSSLAYLQRFPIQKLKIDRSFVQRMPGDGEAIAGAVIAMAHSLRMQVVAEGVEDPEQLALLRDAGCDLGQGYLFSRPQQADALMAWLNRLDNAADSGTAAYAEEEVVPSASLPSSLAG
ncbi:bifunctional diguanylate cyclase/phosphodiesterase [Ralstonia pickettii]|uniref:putative bifunctional diguanylate cyclase/phosphodiesterase n=1 Tax=Ralstonia pickettii TaxID=329 RepID=UPI0015FAC09A|nr:EAL domain-containing protein [Ralstonia pickettii]MBB0026254.1 EAL domain-containing protein [Ralstonia pickettii]MBB0037042.1 EAL domain-containing protein [Ralstonia pickettii]MBB0099582.1 EAL domain-containing protein [Ralstonia pickettii]MBB0109377.1 EAL domain-containing protein [Ralstonia pickettii]MBB0130356.1 EAL domain-containing protein [Ralstonia pickettii]